MKDHSGSSFSAAAVLSVAAVTLGACSATERADTKSSPVQAEQTQTTRAKPGGAWFFNPPSNAMLGLPDDALLKLETMDQARVKIHAQFKIPNEALIGRLKGIYLDNLPSNLTDDSPSVPETRTVYIFYGNDPQNVGTEKDPSEIYLKIHQWPEDPEYAQNVARYKKEKGEGIVKSDTTPHLVSINGRNGRAIAPGYNQFGESKEPRSGFVDWYEDGIRYVVHGSLGPGATELGKLLAIARSMR